MTTTTTTKRVLICNKHGGFSLSRAAFHRLREMGNATALAEPDYGERWSDSSHHREPTGRVEGFCRDIPRDDPMLLVVFDEMGQGAAGTFCELKAVEIPGACEWQVEEYDGLEWVAETHRTWG